MSEQGYKGWKSYQTCVTNLWLSNEEPLYREALDRARQALEDAPDDENVRNNTWTVEETARFRLADDFKTWVTSLMPDLDGLAADLLNATLDDIDWAELAEVWLDQVRETS